MGELDFVKPMLSKLGKVHYGRLNMKPGKPTTFATINIDVPKDALTQLDDDYRATVLRKKTLFFALPGNPVR